MFSRVIQSAEAVYLELKNLLFSESKKRNKGAGPQQKDGQGRSKPSVNEEV